jgi:glycosyltransferase involved in cell wall biosynthesis
MRILHIISSPFSVGGAELVMAELASAQKLHGHEVVVINIFSAENTALRLLANEVPYSEIPCKSICDLLRLITTLRKQIRDFDPDIVHVHLFHAGILMGLLPTKIPIVRIWTFHHGNHTQDSRNYLFQILEKTAARRYEKIVALSPSSTEMLRSKFHLDNQSIEMIPNGWSGAPKHRISTTTVSIVCIAKLRKEKDHVTLIHAFAKLKLKVDSIKLVLVGDGPQLQSLVELTSVLGLEKSISFIGFSNDIWEHLARATIFVLPSRVESFGIVLLEAMAAGVPVVACDAEGPRFLIQNGHNGTLVPVGDVDSLTDSLLSLVSDEELRVKYSTAGLKTAELFHSSRMISNYQSLYLKILTN